MPRFARPNCPVTVTVQDRDGSVITNALVRAALGPEARETRTDADGVAEFPFFKEGTYAVTVTAAGYPAGLGQLIVVDGRGACVIFLDPSPPEGDWTDLAVNGDFSRGAAGWSLHEEPRHHDGTWSIQDNNLVMSQTTPRWAGIVMRQIIDLTGTAWREFEFSAQVEPLKIADTIEPGIGILLDANRSPRMDQKLFVDFRRMDRPGRAVIQGPVPAAYPVFDLWLLVAGGGGSIGRFSQVAFRVR